MKPPDILNYDFHLGNGDNGNVWGIANKTETHRAAKASSTIS